MTQTAAAPPSSGEEFSSASRREYLGQTALVGRATDHATALAVLAASAAAPAAPADPPREASVRLRVNGRDEALTVDTRTSLLDLLREHLDLTGSKKGCDHGQCGACTVLLNGRRVNACLTLAASADGDEVVTVEGLARGDDLHPVQQAFIAHDGFQCGYCTPGQICSAVALVGELRAGWASYVTPDVGGEVSVGDVGDEELRERMSGNVCRCGAYAGILAAVREAVAAEAAGPDAASGRAEVRP